MKKCSGEWRRRWWAQLPPAGRQQNNQQSRWQEQSSDWSGAPGHGEFPTCFSNLLFFCFLQPPFFLTISFFFLTISNFFLSPTFYYLLSANSHFLAPSTTSNLLFTNSLWISVAFSEKEQRSSRKVAETNKKH